MRLRVLRGVDCPYELEAESALSRVRHDHAQLARELHQHYAAVATWNRSQGHRRRLGKPLASAPFLAVADVDAADGAAPRRGAEQRGGADGRIRLAAPLDCADVDALVGEGSTHTTVVTWDRERDLSLIHISEPTRPY